MISSGVFARTGYLPPNGQSGSLPVNDPRRVMQPHGVPVIEMLSEMEAETNLKGRRPDSDEPADRYRLVEIAGASHSSGPPSPIRRIVPAQLAKKGLPSRRHRRRAAIEPPNEFPFGYFATAALDNIHRWVTKGTPPPRAERLAAPRQPRRWPGRHQPGCAANRAGRARQRPRRPPQSLRRRPLRQLLPALQAEPVPAGAARATYAAPRRSSLPRSCASSTARQTAYAAKVEAQVDELVRERWLLAPEGELIKAQARALRF